MYSDLVQALGIENYIEPEVLPPVTEVEMIQSHHELNEALNEVSTVEQDIKTVAGYTDIIERVDPSDINNAVTTEAIYIGLEHTLTKHKIQVGELFPSLESWSFTPEKSKSVSLENVHSLMKGLKQKGKVALDWLVAKYLEWKEKVKSFFRKIFKRKVQEEVKASETGAAEVQKQLALASPQQKKAVEEKLEEQPMVKEAKVTNQASITVTLDSKQAYVIKQGLDHIRSQYTAVGVMMDMDNLIGTMERPRSMGEQIAAGISKLAVLNNFDSLASNNTVFNKNGSQYKLDTFIRNPILDVSNENRVTTSTEVVDYDSVVSETDKTFVVDKAVHDRLLSEIKELLDVYDTYLNDTKMLKELKRGSKRLSDVHDRTTGVVKFVLDCSVQHMESVRLAIDVRREIVKNYPVSSEDLIGWLKSQDNSEP